MHSMPAVVLHPKKDVMALQSMNNEILVWGAQGKFQAKNKKKFTSHQTAGYACQMSVSPDGRFLCTGDGAGKLYYYDWASTKCFQRMQAHDKGPAICVDWHPVEGSLVVSCGWDGVIKLWSNEGGGGGGGGGGGKKKKR